MQILKKECDEFDATYDVVKREKEMYLDEFRNLKDNYEKTIDKLENELHRLKIQNHTLDEDNKFLKNTVDHYKKRT